MVQIYIGLHAKYAIIRKIKGDFMSNNKGKFSKHIVISIIIANVAFTIAVLLAFLKTSTEPSTLIGSWFAFTTVELWSLASIKKTKENNKNGGNYDG